VVEYGCKIHEVAIEIQKKVRDAVEGMTGLRIVEVVVNVLGVNIERVPKEQEKESGSPEEMQELK
jgi:uncharacterized alkaline shock family protein YloU